MCQHYMQCKIVIIKKSLGFWFSIIAIYNPILSKLISSTVKVLFSQVTKRTLFLLKMSKTAQKAQTIM